jgi:hypothetical protein
MSQLLPIRVGRFVIAFGQRLTPDIAKVVRK